MRDGCDPRRAAGLIAVERGVTGEPLERRPRVREHFGDGRVIRKDVRRQQVRDGARRPLVVGEDVDGHRSRGDRKVACAAANPQHQLGAAALELVDQPVAVERELDGIEVKRPAGRDRADVRGPLGAEVRQQRDLDREV